MIPFVSLFPDQGEAETRTLTTFNHSKLPDDEYALVEFYCPDPSCDCHRCTLNVVGRRQGFRPLAVISYGFDRDAEMAGPFLDPLRPRGPTAQALLELVESQVLSDPGYVARLKAHYAQVKRACADPAHPVQQKRRQSSPAPLNRAARRAQKRQKGW